MLFKRSFFSEFVNTSGATFTVFFTIFFAVSMVQFITSATIGRIDPSVVFELMLYNALKNLSPLLAGCVFIGVLLVLFRSWQDNEMVVWFSSGARSLGSFISPLLLIAIPMVIITAILSLVLTPWSTAQNQEVNNRLGTRDDLSLITPGRFVEPGSRDMVFFIDNVTADNQIQRVFVASLHPDREDTVWAKNAHVEVNEEGDRYVMLSDGRRYETQNDSAKTRVTSFKDYGLRVDVKLDDPLNNSKTSAKPTMQLVKENTPQANAELFWRFSWSLVVFNLIFLAAPLSSSNPRAGRILNFVLAVMCYIVYLNLIYIMMGYITKGTFNLTQGLFILHGGVFALIVALYIRWLFFIRWYPRWMSLWYWRHRKASKES